MSTILVTLASVFAIAGATWAARRLLGLPVCPICLGVGGTWLWMLVARELGYAIDATMLAVLLGASVAGIAYLIEKRLPHGRSALLWKTLFIPSGAMAAYALVAQLWPVVAVASVVLVLLAAFFLFAPAGAQAPSRDVEELTARMKNCC
jgi:hypothetical protein